MERLVQRRGELTPSELVETVLDELRTRDGLLPGTLADRATVLRRFAAYAENTLRIGDANRVDRQGAELFVHAIREDGSEPSHADRHRRRASVRLLYSEARRLHLVNNDPARDIDLPPRSTLGTRPLTDDELELGRSWAVSSLTNLRRAIAWALSEAAAWTSEVTAARVGDVDLDNLRVWLHGNPTKDSRWAPLTEWGARQLERRFRQLDPPGSDTPLVPWRAPPTSRHAAASQAIKETIRAAGLDREPDVRPRSIVAWRGRNLLQQGHDIVAVAQTLGYRSLDEAALFVGLAWRGGGQR